MADTQRSVAEILALMGDNITGNISPQDIRDQIISMRPTHAQLYVAVADAAAISIADTTSYFECTAPAWTLSSGAYSWDESSGNGELTYTGAADVTAFVSVTISFTTASNNQVVHWRIGKNGVPDGASEQLRKTGTGADVGSITVHEEVSMSTNDYVSLFVRNDTSTANVTVEACNMTVLTAID